MVVDTTPFVSTEWLAANLDAPDLVVVDGSWHMPDTGRIGAREFEAQHIPGAVFFDIDAISDLSSPLPHMLLAPNNFAQAVSALGIGDGLRIVVYDSVGLFSAPRVRWTFQAYGARDVKILDGGLPKWLAEGRPVDSGRPHRPPSKFTARLDHSIVADINMVERALNSGHIQVLDARGAPRFRGEVPEPREGVRRGHMPGSINLPQDKVQRDGRLLPPDELRAVMEEAGIDLARPTITSCGSGITAAVLWLALESIGKPSLALYDGSWTEWGTSGKPVDVG